MKNLFIKKLSSFSSSIIIHFQHQPLLQIHNRAYKQRKIKHIIDLSKIKTSLTQKSSLNVSFQTIHKFIQTIVLVIVNVNVKHKSWCLHFHLTKVFYTKLKKKFYVKNVCFCFWLFHVKRKRGNNRCLINWTHFILREIWYIPVAAIATLTLNRFQFFCK